MRCFYQAPSPGAYSLASIYTMAAASTLQSTTRCSDAALTTFRSCTFTSVRETPPTPIRSSDKSTHSLGVPASAASARIFHARPASLQPVVAAAAAAYGLRKGGAVSYRE